MVYLVYTDMCFLHNWICQSPADASNLKNIFMVAGQVNLRIHSDWNVIIVSLTQWLSFLESKQILRLQMFLWIVAIKRTYSVSVNHLVNNFSCFHSVQFWFPLCFQSYCHTSLSIYCWLCIFTKIKHPILRKASSYFFIHRGIFFPLW